jgi:hypothetical protein
MYFYWRIFWNVSRCASTLDAEEHRRFRFVLQLQSKPRGEVRAADSQFRLGI